MVVVPEPSRILAAVVILGNIENNYNFMLFSTSRKNPYPLFLGVYP
jgi:hypothetical protein